MTTIVSPDLTDAEFAAYSSAQPLTSVHLVHPTAPPPRDFTLSIVEVKGEYVVIEDDGGDDVYLTAFDDELSAVRSYANRVAELIGYGNRLQA